MTNVSSRIVGNYVLGPLLGRGGTSEVYAATHRFLGDEVAVKLLRAELAIDEAAVRAFVEEAARTREIAHASVVRVIDFGRDDSSGSCFLVMERIAGETLSARIATRGRLGESELRALAAAIADGMAAAHARGIVHRDLKPGNVMMRDEQPTIVDFGIAKSLDASSAVVTSRRIGTLAYMAPEQLTEGMITPAADVWALGVVMYEAATGQRPFDNFADGRLPQLFDTPARAASFGGISPALDGLIARCLDRSPSNRPTMKELAAALRAGDDVERVTEDAGPVGAPAGVARASAKQRRRWPFAVAGAAIVVAGVVAIVAVAGHSHDADRSPPAATNATPSEASPASAPPTAASPASAPPTAASPASAPPTAAAPPPPAATPISPALTVSPAAPAKPKPTTKPKRRGVRRTTTGETLD